MKFKEWPPGEELMRNVDDAGLVIEGCYSNGMDRRPKRGVSDIFGCSNRIRRSGMVEQGSVSGGLKARGIVPRKLLECGGLAAENVFDIARDCAGATRTIELAQIQYGAGVPLGRPRG